MLQRTLEEGRKEEGREERRKKEEGREKRREVDEEGDGLGSGIALG